MLLACGISCGGGPQPQADATGQGTGTRGSQPSLLSRKHRVGRGSTAQRHEEGWGCVPAQWGRERPQAHRPQTRGSAPHRRGRA